MEELFASADLPLGELPWEQWVRRFVGAVAGLAREHPGAFAALLRRPVQGPRATATFEAGLAAFQRAGMDIRESYACVKSVALAVLGCCMEQAFAAAGSELRTDVSSLSWRDFPLVHEASTTAEDVDLVVALEELLVGGLTQRLDLTPASRR